MRQTGWNHTNPVTLKLLISGHEGEDGLRMAPGLLLVGLDAFSEKGNAEARAGLE